MLLESFLFLSNSPENRDDMRKVLIDWHLEISKLYVDGMHYCCDIDERKKEKNIL
jgi:hypothetical protein